MTGLRLIPVAIVAGKRKIMDRSQRPYFFWDYDIAEEDIRRILTNGNPTEKA